MKIKTSEFKKVVDTVLSGIDETDTIKGASYIRFQRDRLVTYDGNICYLHPFETGIEANVKGMVLKKILSSVDEEEIEMECLEGMVFLRISKTRIKLNTLVEIEPLTWKEPEEWIKITPDFIEGLKTAEPSCLKRFGNPALSCLHITSEHIEATDSLRYTCYRLENSLPLSDPILLPWQFSKLAIAINPTHVHFTKEWVAFKNEEGVIFFCKTVLGEFPNAKTIREAKGELLNIPFVDVLNSLIKSQSILVDEEKESVCVSMNFKDKLIKVVNISKHGRFMEVLHVQTPFKEEKTIKLAPYLFEGIDGSKEYSCSLVNTFIKIESLNALHIIALKV